MKLSGLSTNRYVHGEWTAKSGYILARKVLEKYPDTTAVYSASDIIGLGVLKYLNENKKLKKLENDFDKLQTSLSDKEKIIGLYEFMLNGNPPITNISSTSVVKRMDA